MVSQGTNLGLGAKLMLLFVRARAGVGPSVKAAIMERPNYSTC